jgi:beta-galactosidase
VDYYGLVKGFGTRRHYCPSNHLYREYSAKITAEMAEHYKHNSNIIAWQIDNEFGGQCCCESCRAGFIERLQRKYKNLDVLNNAWGTVFWSQTYDEWDQIITPKYSASDGFAQNAGNSKIPSTPFNHNPGMLLDYFRFFSDNIVQYQKIQVDILRRKAAYRLHTILWDITARLITLILQRIWILFHGMFTRTICGQKAPIKVFPWRMT